MTAPLDSLGPAIWRASWQAAALALVVALLFRCFKDRLAPRWRFLLWGVVLARLLCVATPGSPWSMFNLGRWNLQVNIPSFAHHQTNPGFTPIPGGSSPPAGTFETNAESPAIARAEAEPTEAPLRSHAPTTTIPAGTESESMPSTKVTLDGAIFTRILSAIWLVGCVVMGLKLVTSALSLRRRLSACRPVTDAAILDLLETSRIRIGLKRSPALLVTPESLSPCIVGIWHSRIVLPESVVTELSSTRLYHVLAHELAHLARGDLWTNWLLLAARIVHWFSPVAWWTVLQMQIEREAACDELAFAALGDSDRTAYAATIVELAASLTPSATAPGFIGLFSSTSHLKARVERLLRTPSVRRLRAPLAAALLLGTALLGLTDAMPDAAAQAPKVAGATRLEDAKPNTYALSGRCVNHADNSVMAGVTVRLYQVEGRTAPAVEIARTITDADGRYTFTTLVPPRRENHLNRLDYAVLGFADGRPIGLMFMHFDGKRMVTSIRMADEQSTISGKVIDAEGQPVAGAAVAQLILDGRPVFGLPSATTDAQGRFKLDNVPVYKAPDGTIWAASFTVLHPDYPRTTGQASALPAEVVVTLPTGCVVAGTVTDKVTGGPGAGVVITARWVDEWGEAVCATDASGRFRLVVPEGRYDFLVDAFDRVCVAQTGHECQAGEKVGLPQFALIGGGLISGRVLNTATNAPVTVSENGEPIMLGLYGPSQPGGRSISPVRLAAVDKLGRFVLRAVPGENFPYFVNTRGVRMAWDTRNQPPVVVNDGQTTVYDMLITPEVPPAERLKAARKRVESLSKNPSDRTAQILLEFRKLNHTVDETELWCLLMRELGAVGRSAVPQLCEELDRTTENRMLRRLGFALRAIGDPRSAPALIRAITRTPLASSSDYGLDVSDQELMDFMQTHDLEAGKRGRYFSFGRPERENIGALHRVTGHNLNDEEVLGMSLSEDPRRQVLQRRAYTQQALRWQEWWEKNWRGFTDDDAFQKVNLSVAEEPLPPAPDPQALAKTARLSGEMMGAVLSPVNEKGPYVWHFFDLDTGYKPNWPAEIPRNSSARNSPQLANWAAQHGVDLMCVTHRQPDGRETYVLKALGMKVTEISARDLRNLDRLLAAGRLPEGRPVGELLMHFDPQLQELVADANGAFLFVTREGNIGLIETTDRVTQKGDLTGQPAGSPPTGVGFYRGVRFNLSAIVP
jgi:beta-lactamase regulating signal transducer with metallopeptidase domain